MYSPSILYVVSSLQQADRSQERERDSFARAAREAARARRAPRRHRLRAGFRAHSIMRPAVITALIAGAFGAGHAL